MTATRMVPDRFVRILLAMMVVAVSAVVVCWPTRLSAHDQWGYQISCGSSVMPDYEQATAADAATTERRHLVGYVDRCQHTVFRHRLYAAGLAALGALLAALTALGVRTAAEIPRTATE